MGSRVEVGCNDGGGRGSGGEAMERASERESSPEYRVPGRRGGARGHMVSGGNGQRPRRHDEDNQALRQTKKVVECRHHEKKEGGRKTGNKVTELRRDRQGKA